MMREVGRRWLVIISLVGGILCGTGCSSRPEPEYVHNIGAGERDSHGHTLEDLTALKPRPSASADGPREPFAGNSHDHRSESVP